MLKTIKVSRDSRTVKTIKSEGRTVKTVKTTSYVKTVRKRVYPHNGEVVYTGPSRIDGKPIVAVVTFKSSNPKTGDMAQLWILRSDVNPIVASQTGEDYSICGSCPLAGIVRALAARALLNAMRDGKPLTKRENRGCYVNLLTAPNQIYKSFRGGRYPLATDESLKRGIKGRAIRLGAYGDPVALPIEVIERLTGLANGYSGYTHQWRSPLANGFSRYLMASVQSESEVAEALAMGWRTFRVRRESDPVLATEIICPASPEGGNRKDCASCQACNGFSRTGQSSVVIIGHGGVNALRNVNRTVASLATTSQN